MNPTPFLLVAVVLALFMGLLGWTQRDSPLARPYLALTVAIVVWVLAYIWELEATGLQSMVLSAKVQYLSIPFVPLAVLAFCQRYVGHDDWPSKSVLAALLLVPLATAALAWTNEYHGLIWSEMDVQPAGTKTALSLSYGWFFRVYVATGYAYLLAAFYLVARPLVRATAMSRRQSALIILALLLPWIANFLQVSGLNPFHPLDLTPFAFIGTCMIAAVATMNLKLLTLAPVARHQILTALTDGIVVVDESGRVVDVNRAASVLLSTTRSQAVGQRASDVLGPFVGAMEERAENGTLVTVTAGPKERTFHCTWVEVEGRSGRPLGGALALHDVTDLTGLHRALAEARDELEEEVLDRTQELTRAYGRLTEEVGRRKVAQDQERALEARLRHSQKLETVGTLAGGIAHDFNNILTSIMGYTDLATHRSGSDGPLRNYLNHIAAASQRAKGLVEQILTFSRRVEIERRPMSLQAAVDEVVGLMRSTLPATIEIIVSVDEDCGPVKADPTQIHQLLMNLGTNAREAMSGQNGTLSIQLEAAEARGAFDVEHADIQGKACARLIVSDTGHAIDEATRERLFEPFFTTRRPGQGTGLGLSVVHGIVLGHEGAIRVESSEGQGTSFHVYLPLAEVAQPEMAPRPPPAQVGSERLLVVDDEEQITCMLQESLSALGYRVTAFNDSEAALNAFLGNPDQFDLVITDQTMPHLSGLELAEQMVGVRPDMPIILQTGVKDREATRRPLAVVTSLQKPLSTGELTQAIRTALD